MASRDVKTPEAILSYPTLVEPKLGPDGKGDPKYSCALVFPKGTNLDALKAAALLAAEEKFGGKAKDMLAKKQLKLPFRTDTEAKGYPDGSVFINVRTTRKPTVVNQIPDANGKPTVIDAESLYAGCIVKATLTAFGYDTAGNKGISFGLNNMQFIRDCKPEDRLDGRRAAQDEFDADENAVADLSDLDELVGVGADEGDVLADLGL